MTGSVSPARAVGLTLRLLLRQLLTRGRVIALLLLGGVTILAAVGVAVSDDVHDAAVTTIEIIDGLGLVLVVPIVSLVFASASLGDGREDGTLVYLWLRPMDRLPVVVGAYLASLTISLPLTVAPLGAAAAVGGAGADGITATVIASVIGVVAYSALFVLLGLLVKNSIIWGLAYVLLWEGLFNPVLRSDRPSRRPRLPPSGACRPVRRIAERCARRLNRYRSHRCRRCDGRLDCDRRHAPRAHGDRLGLLASPSAGVRFR